MNSIFESLDNLHPDTITILPTYRCNAACSQCCFESNPTVQGRLSREEIFDIIKRAKEDFSSLRLVVFSGGECTLLKKDLYDAISLCTSLGLLTRIVSNAGWGKTKRTADGVAEKLSASGLTELNISTGLDHQKYVPLASVLHAAESALDRGIKTLITIEKDSADSTCLNDITNSATVKRLSERSESIFTIMSNTWMPFNDDRWIDRGKQKARLNRSRGCEQLFHNLVFTPYKEVSACCGLTFEYIPELKIGTISKERALTEIYEQGLNDFLKIWIHLDGPEKIVTQIMGEGEHSDAVNSHVHICQSCVYMYQNPEIRDALRKSYSEHFQDVMTRFVAARTIRNRLSESSVV